MTLSRPVCEKGVKESVHSWKVHSKAGSSWRSLLIHQFFQVSVVCVAIGPFSLDRASRDLLRLTTFGLLCSEEFSALSLTEYWIFGNQLHVAIFQAKRNYVRRFVLLSAPPPVMLIVGVPSPGLVPSSEVLAGIGGNHRLSKLSASMFGC